MSLSNADVIKSKKLYLIKYDLEDGEIYVIFKLIPWKEFKRVFHAKETDVIPENELWNLIFKLYTVIGEALTEEDILELPAGVVITTAKVIFQMSNSFGMPSRENGIELDKFINKLNYARMMSKVSIEKQLFALICSVYKGYTFSSLEEMDFNEILELFVAAENHLLNIGVLQQHLSFSPVGSNGETIQEQPAPKMDKQENQGQVKLTNAEKQMLIARQAQEEKNRRMKNGT